MEWSGVELAWIDEEGGVEIESYGAMSCCSVGSRRGRRSGLIYTCGNNVLFALPHWMMDYSNVSTGGFVIAVKSNTSTCE